MVKNVDALWSFIGSVECFYRECSTVSYSCPWGANKNEKISLTYYFLLKIGKHVLHEHLVIFVEAPTSTTPNEAMWKPCGDFKTICIGNPLGFPGNP